jgi:hypothetical protein
VVGTTVRTVQAQERARKGGEVKEEQDKLAVLLRLIDVGEAVTGTGDDLR